MQTMPTQICRICRKELRLKVSFYKNTHNKNGYDKRCKECQNVLSRESHRRNYNPEKEAIKYLERKKQGKHIKNHNDMIKKYPEKHKARYQLRNALKSGKITKQICETCGDKNTQAHHHDYSKPLDVIWLCLKHHKEIHHKTSLITNESGINQLI